MPAPVEDKKSFWPYGLIIGITVFVSAMVALVVYLSFFHQQGLVEREYYNEQLQHDNQMAKEERTGRLAEGVGIDIRGDQQLMVVQMPDELAGQEITGTIHFYRPSDEALDRQIPLEPEADGSQQVDLSEMREGRWRVKISWAADSQDYYQEEVVNLP